VKPRIIVSVSNDLSFDQRVDKVCRTLVKTGFDVLLVGRLLKTSVPLNERPYKTQRIKLLFTKGPLFYAELNICLFFFLLFRKAKVLLANDLDTLLPNFLVSKIKGVELVYDSHEYFTEVPELTNRKFVQRIWTSIEKWIFPELKYVFTVNDSIAELYRKKYNVDVKVIRNVPFYEPIISAKTKTELSLPIDKKIIILQGAWINIDRGAEEAVLAMKSVEGAILYIIGGGDVIDELHRLVNKHVLQNKVRFLPRQPYYELKQYTLNADIGLTLDKDTNLNYRFSLPNKIFDYMHAGIPMLATKLPEIEKVFSKYEMGVLVEKVEPELIAEKINFMLSNVEKQQEWKQNAKLARKEFCWQNEELKLIEVYKQFLD